MDGTKEKVEEIFLLIRWKQKCWEENVGWQAFQEVAQQLGQKFRQPDVNEAMARTLLDDRGLTPPSQKLILHFHGLQIHQ